MTAGVQNIDSAAYLPPPPAASSTPDAKGTSAAGKQPTDPQATDQQDGPSDFQSELALQQTAKPATEPVSAKTESGKSSKKRNVRQDESNLLAVTPTQVAEPQKQILPLVFALPQASPLVKDEPVKSDQNAKSDANAKSNVNGQVPGAQTLPDPDPTVAVIASPIPIDDSNETPAPSPDSGKAPVPTTPRLPIVAQASLARQQPKKFEDSSLSAADQLITPARTAASPSDQSTSQAELTLPPAPSEPVAKAVREATDSAPSAPSTPSVMAFAARISTAQQVAQQTAEQTATIPALSPSQSPATSGSQTSVQIPVRYAATAQIIPQINPKVIQSSAVGTQQDGFKKDTGDSDEKFARPDARIDATRNDMVLPRFETSSEPAPTSGSAQQPAPTARPESIVEPPAAPPTSSHDIRVRVPDNNGGSTQVRFLESNGEVRVSVRTADEGLAQNLRTHLNDLNQRLSDGGMPAEIWKPASNAASSQSDQHQQTPQDGRGSGGQGSGGQSGQQDRQQKRPAWLDEMEASLHGEQN